MLDFKNLAKIQFVYKFSSQSVIFRGPYFDFFGLSSQNKKAPLSDSSKTAKTEAKKLDKDHPQRSERVKSIFFWREKISIRNALSMITFGKYFVKH